MSDDISSTTKNPTIDTRAVWGPWRAILGWVVSFFGAQVLVSLLFITIVGAMDASSSEIEAWRAQPEVQFVFLLCAHVVTTSILWLFLRKFSKKQILQGLGLRKPRLKDVGHMLLGVLLYFGAYIAIMTVVSSMTPINLEQQQDIGFDGARGFQNLVWVFAALVILPPIVEEIIFRGFLYGGLRKANNVVTSAIVTSVIFGYLHSSQAVDDSILWVATIDTFIMLLVLVNSCDIFI